MKPVTPLITVDIIIELIDFDNKFVLIERYDEPHGWAFPGGFVDIGESLEDAAIREAFEETSLTVTLNTLLGMYSKPDRDHRGHAVSAVYVATASGAPFAADDAKNSDIFTFDSAPHLVFDHSTILSDYKRFKETGATAPLRV